MKRSDDKQRGWGNSALIVFAAFVAGAAAGAVVSLMYAPSDGSTLRSNLSQKASSAKEGAVTVANSLTRSYGKTHEIAKFQVERLFAAVGAGIQESRRVRLEILASAGEHKSDKS